MRTVLNGLIVLFIIITAVSLGFFIYYRLTFNPSASFTGKVSAVTSLNSERSSVSKPTLEKDNQESVPEDLLSQVENLSSVVTSYFVKVKNGTSVYPALVFKIVPLSGGLKVYLLTFYPMEWPFVKVSIMGETLGAPQEVYQCPGGFLLLGYSVRGIFPVEVERGELGQYGVLITWTGSDFYPELFDESKGCKDIGFVFNLSGDFSGVCFGGVFYTVNELYSSVPDSCKIIFQQEGENGNLQG